MTYTIPFSHITLKDLNVVGGKNASLGEMYNQMSGLKIRIPQGFATTAHAYRIFLKHNNLEAQLKSILADLDTLKYANLSEIGKTARSLILSARIPDDLSDEFIRAYEQLSGDNELLSVAVRSSATAEDLPDASFAGQLESFLNVQGKEAYLRALHHCYTSLYTDRAIKYREDHGFGHENIDVSVGVQKMVRSDKGSSGVAFTLDPDTGFRNAIVINAIWGLGENIVQGRVNPDEFIIFKEMLGHSEMPIISKKIGSKQQTLMFGTEGDQPLINKTTPADKQRQFALNDQEVIELAKWCQSIEDHYERPMDIEWAKDGLTDKLYIVQARPETVYSGYKGAASITTYTLTGKGAPISEGIALGEKIASGKARILKSSDEAHKLGEGDVLVTDITNPDWDPVMKRAAAIVTNKGGRTSHAAIVARELGLVAVVGCKNATERIKDGQEVTVSCAEGKTGRIYPGKVNWEENTVDLTHISLPATKPMFILGDPDLAFKYSFLPNQGVGLLRLEFIIANSVGVHPLALTRLDQVEEQVVKQKLEKLTQDYPEPTDYFIDKLAQGVAMIAAAFYPKDVIVRMSDFKSNEYANLLGGKQFEPHEENPMLGFRGASRYYSEYYREGFELECKAMKRVREKMGLKNVKLMIPFCRTVEEGQKVVDTMMEFGLEQGENNLEIYMMVEVPSNVVMAEDFADIFDGFSIGSNDLTQLMLGLDRDTVQIAQLFSEQNPAVTSMIAKAITAAHKKNIPIGLCGQAPSDFPEFTRFLVEEGIDSISFNPDALLRGIEHIHKAEENRPEGKEKPFSRS